MFADINKFELSSKISKLALVNKRYLIAKTLKRSTIIKRTKLVPHDVHV